MLVCADFYTVLGPKADIAGQILSPRLSSCVRMYDQLSAQVVFMKLSENLFF